MNGAELAGASRTCLRACALTYVAAALTSLLQLIYMVLSTRSEDCNAMLASQVEQQQGDDEKKPLEHLRGA